MIAFVAGLVIGGLFGVMIMALCTAASKADAEMEKFNTK